MHRTDRVLVDGAEYFDQEMNPPYRREQRKALLEILRSRNFGGGSPAEGVIRINPGPRHSSTPLNFSSRATMSASGAEGDSRRAVEVAIVALREADPAAYLMIQEVFNVDVGGYRDLEFYLARRPEMATHIDRGVDWMLDRLPQLTVEFPEPVGERARDRLLNGWARLAEAGMSKDEILVELAKEYELAIRVIKKIIGRSRVYQD